MAYVLYVMDAVYEKSAEWKVSVLGITNREKLIAFSKSVKFLFIRTECQFQVLSMYVCVYVCMYYMLEVPASNLNMGTGYSE